jgi:5-methylcytosine-specific restriction endonuclease McrA
MDRRRKAGIPKKNKHFYDGILKSCGSCKEIKPASDFNKAHRSIGGLQSRCKTCVRQEKDREKECARVAAYRLGNMHYRSLHRLNQFNRKSRIAAQSDGTATADFMNALYAEEVCYYCLKTTPEKQRTADHKTPLSRGGPHSASNLVMACFKCNSKKGALTDAEFKERMNDDNFGDNNSQQRSCIGSEQAPHNSSLPLPQVDSRRIQDS